MHCLTSIWHAIFLLTILFRTPILAGRRPHTVVAYRAARAANIAQIEALRAAVPNIRDRPPIIVGPCRLEAEDRAHHRTNCIPAHCFDAGGRCVSIRTRATSNPHCVQHVVKSEGSFGLPSREEVVQHRWSRGRKHMPYLLHHCQGCVCRNVVKGAAYRDVKGAVVDDGDVVEEANGEENREKSKDSDVDSGSTPNGFSEVFNLEAIMKDYPI